MLPLPHSTQAYDINDIGQAVGDSTYLVDTASGETRQQGALFQDGAITGLGILPGGLYSAAHAINQQGVAVGWSGLDFRGPDVANATHAVIYNQGRIIDLGVLPGDLNSYAQDINSAGWVVGSSEALDEVARAFLYADGQMYDLNDLIKRNSGWTLRGATGLNDRGQIVGWGLRDGQPRGFLLTPRK
jgi:probable HAF family extracellular repeat protein